MSPTLTNTLNLISAERSGEFNKSFDAVDCLLSEYGEKNLAERLYSDIDPNIPWEVVADLYAILIWSTSDNGHALTNVTEQWLENCTCLRQVQIALNLDVYPFLNKSKMDKVLNKVALEFPETSETCSKMIKTRNS